MGERPRLSVASSERLSQTPLLPERGDQGGVPVLLVAGVLRIEVTDFGLGGADPSAGTALAGVEKRFATFDGVLAVSSPAGGPTIVVLEMPCALSSLKTSSY